VEAAGMSIAGLGDTVFDVFPTWVVAGFSVFALIVVACVWRHQVLLRLPLWLLSKSLYRLRIRGREQIPRHGPALLVCNSVPQLDAFLLLVAQRRRIRFIVWSPVLPVPLLRWWLRLANAITIDSAGGPLAVMQATRSAAEALARGELVCVFAENGVTSSGFPLPFHEAFEQIIERAPAPIIPVCLDVVWGSLFSYQGWRGFWKAPLHFRYPVSIGFGAALPATSSAIEVLQAQQKLSADGSLARTGERLPVHRRFLRTAARHPLRTCFIDPLNAKKPRYRYGEVLAAAKILTERLRPLLGDEKMIGLWLPPTVGGAIANIAVAFLGKTSVNLNYTSSPDGVRSAIRQCGIRHVLTSHLFLAKLPLDPGPGAELIPLERFRKVVTTWQRLRAFLSVLLLPAFVQERWILKLAGHSVQDLATVIFSSGSTGEPKGVMLTHDNIAANAESMLQAVNLRPRDRALGVLPFFHSFGYTVTIWVPLQVGASVVYHVDPRQAQEIGALCRVHRCTVYLSTATFLRFCLRRCEAEDFATVRLLICGAEKLPTALAEEFRAKFGVHPLEGYGCTELSPVVSTNLPDWRFESLSWKGNKSGTIGHPLPGVAARIVHPDSFENAPPGTEGLLLILGANVMAGYLNRPEETATALRDGWYVTGDIAKFDDDGFLIITDRLSRFSKVAGEMVPHQKIEDELHSILGTNERACVVTAVPDHSKGERIVVLHLPLNGVDVPHLLEGLSSKGLPNLWVPHERDFIQILELPVLGSGKVDLKRVKDLALENAKE
jgi:acyl-[acyl-carrier-protein]-phospholipid O-acyltransferase/long-chain-fatty-acid--[acyl-carrier-protein] ligase